MIRFFGCVVVVDGALVVAGVEGVVVVAEAGGPLDDWSAVAAGASVAEVGGPLDDWSAAAAAASDVDVMATLCNVSERTNAR